MNENNNISRQYAFTALEILYKKYFNERVETMEEYTEKLNLMEVEFKESVVGAQKLNIWHDFCKNSLLRFH